MSPVYRVSKICPDGVKEAAKHIADASFISIPGLGHGEAFYRCDPILLHAKRFLPRVTS